MECPKEGFKLVEDLEGKMEEERLRSLLLFGLQETEERSHGGLHFPQEGSRGPGTELCSLGTVTKLKGTA